MTAILRKYGVATTIPFSLFEIDGIDFRVDAVYASGDVKITKDEGAEANITTGFVDEGSKYSIAVSATEMQAARISLIFIDQTATKVWLDADVEIETYGNASAEHAFDLDTASVAQTGDGYAIVNDSVFGNSALNDSLSQIANIGAAINVSVIAAPNGFTLTTGSEVNDEDVTIPLDGTRHELSDAAGTLDAIYKFDIGGDAAPVSVTFTGIYNSGNDDFIISGNTGSDASPVWVQIGTLEGTNSSGDVVHTFTMFSNMVVSDITGQVQIRVNNTGLTSSSFDTDQVFVSKSSTSRSVGYANGSIWVDTNASNTNTEPFVDGVGDNKVSTWAAALTLSGLLGITDFHIINGSTIQLSANSDNYSLFGDNWTLDLNGQSIASAHFEGAIVSGTGTGATRPEFARSELGTCTLVPFVANACGLNGTITFSAAGDYEIANSHSSVAGSSTPILDTGATVANVNLTMPDYDQGIEIRNLNTLGTDLFSISGKGQIIYAASSSGTVNQRGDWKVTNTGGVTITTDDNTTGIADKTGYSLAATGLDAIVSTATGMVEIAKAIWDRIISKANHDISGSAGKVLRGAGSFIIRENTAQGPGTGNNQIQLDTGASAVDGAYDPSRVLTGPGGTGPGQSRNILQYDGATKTATVDRNWKVNPDATTEFILLSDAGREHVNEGLAQAGGASTITLNTLASSDNNSYPGQIVFIRSGTGEDQAKLVLSYDGSTKIATVDGTWGVNPDSTSGYVMLPSSPVNLSTATQASIDAIEADTNELQADDIPTLIAALPTQAEVNLEMLDVMTVDLFAEPSSVPAATSSIKDKLGFNFTIARNKMTQTATTGLLRNDADSGTIGTSTVSDDTVTFVRGEWI
jgi:hypothetical protein